MPDADLIIVGAGICGSTAARTARSLGANVLHVAAPDSPHSAAAAAVARSTYLTELQRPALPISLSLLTSSISAVGALFSNYQTPHKAPEHRSDWYLIDPLPALLPPDLTCHVEHAEPGKITTDTGTYTASATLLATGATSPLSPQGTITWGTTFLGPSEHLTYPDQLRVHLYAPYKAITAGTAGGRARVGSSSGPTPQAAEEAAHKLMDVALDCGIVADPTGFTPHTGAHLRTERTRLFHTPTHAWVGGHHRNGYAYGTYDADATVRRLLANLQDRR